MHKIVRDDEYWGKFKPYYKTDGFIKPLPIYSPVSNYVLGYREDPSVFELSNDEALSLISESRRESRPVVYRVDFPKERTSRFDRCCSRPMLLVDAYVLNNFYESGGYDRLYATFMICQHPFCRKVKT